MTRKEAWESGTGILRGAGIDEASLDAWYLLEFAAGLTKASYYMEPEAEISKLEEERFFALIERRSSRIPLQHLTGVQEFMGLEFSVNEHVLIPRQDTEVLVEKALDLIKEMAAGVRVLDMCTGSGCILLSLLYYMQERIAIGIGADISRKALEMACHNAEKLHLPAKFVHSDLFEEIEGKFDLIVSNPPYIRSGDIAGLQEEVRLHDPVAALDGSADGLYFYREIIDQAKLYLAETGWLLFEIGADQGKSVSAMMRESGFREVTVKKDLAGLDRIVFGVYDRKDEFVEKGR